MDIRKYSFSQKTINEWNKLSTHCVNASTLNMFKNKIDKYLRRAGYTWIKKTVGPSISPWLPCPLAIWVFALGDNLVKFFTILNQLAFIKSFNVELLCQNSFMLGKVACHVIPAGDHVDCSFARSALISRYSRCRIHNHESGLLIIPCL